MKFVLGAAAVVLGLWPLAVGCGASTRTDSDGTAAHAGADNAAGASGGGAAGARAFGGSSGSEATSGHAEQGGRSSGGQSAAGESSLGGTTAGGGATSSSSGRAGGGESGAGGNAISCVGAMPHFPEFDRSCSTAADCSVVTHTTNCCGSMLAIGIAATETAAFNSAEAVCDAQYPACGCASQGVQVEDGSQVGWSWKPEVKVSCDSGSCRAHYVGATFACGANTCTDKQYCSMSSGGPEGTEPSANCLQTTCTDCACLKLDSVACSCSVSNGHLVVSCRRA